MTDETVFHKGFLRQISNSEERMKNPAIVDDGESRFLQERKPLLLCEPFADLHDQPRYIDFRRSDLPAATAGDAQALDILGILHLVEPGGKYRADAPRVHMTEDVASDKTVHGTHVEAGCTSDALESLPELGIFRHLRTPVVHEDNV